MKLKLSIFISITILIVMGACTTNSLKSGIGGTLQYGEGSCVFDQSFRTYYPYSGYVYFVNSTVADTSGLPITQLLSISDSTTCTGGKFDLKLEVGTYYLCIREYPILLSDNYFTIQPNQTTEQDFFIYKCI